MGAGEPDSNWLRRISSVRTGLLDLLFIVALVGLSCAFSSELWRIHHDNSVQIAAFRVPEEFPKLGLSGEVIALRLQAMLTRMGQESKTSKSLRGIKLLSASQDLPEIEVPGTGGSVQSLVRWILREKPEVEGTISCLSDHSCELQLRFEGKELPAISFDPTEIKQALAKAAEALLSEVDPLALAAYFRAAGEREKALAQVELCLANRSFKDIAWAYNLWGILLLEQNPRAAIGKFNRAILADSEFDLAYLNWGLAACQLRDAESRRAGLRKFEEASYLKVPSASMLNAWGACLADQDEKDRAVEMFRRAIALDPKLATTYYNWGMLLLEEGDARSARGVLANGILVDPNFAEAHALIGRASYELDDPEAAERSFKRALLLEKDVAQIYVAWGGVLFKEKRFSAALEKFSLAVKVDPKTQSAYVGAGLAYLKLRQVTLACNEFERAHQLDPKNPDALNGLSLCALSRNDLGATIAYAEQSLEIRPSDASPYLNWASALLEEGDLPGALAKYEKAVLVDPRKELISRAAWASALRRAGRLEEAQQQENLVRELRKTRGEALPPADPKP